MCILIAIKCIETLQQTQYLMLLSITNLITGISKYILVLRILSRYADEMDYLSMSKLGLYLLLFNHISFFETPQFL